MNERRYNVGDVVFYHPPSSNIVIETKIERIYENSDCIYDIDEPVGHCVDEDDLFDSFEQAKELIEEYINTKDKNYIRIRYEKLIDYRIATYKYIVGTWPEEWKVSYDEFVKDLPSDRKVIFLKHEGL